MKEELKGEQILVTKRRARQELLAKSIQRETINTTNLQEDRTSRIETLRTLESVEAKVEQHKNNANSVSRKKSDIERAKMERVRHQSMKHREDMERLEMERQGELLERLTKRKKALETYEKAKRKACQEIQERNEAK